MLLLLLLLGPPAARVPQQRLGLTVVRTWAFNTGMPLRSGLYDEDQQASLDYVLAAAGRRGIKFVLALGNFWHHYVSQIATTVFTGSTAGRPLIIGVSWFGCYC
jgi:hypothetical protein